LLSAAEVIRLLDLKPHPEGGHFRETFRDSRPFNQMLRQKYGPKMGRGVSHAIRPL
jgi:predicted cupin superfamily sugar epimerase